MQIYTGSGDGGETSLFGGERVAKTDPRVEAYGTLDELNAAIGEAVALMADATDVEAAATSGAQAEPDGKRQPEETPGGRTEPQGGEAAASGAGKRQRTIRQVCQRIQGQLFEIGGELASPEAEATVSLTAAATRWLEEEIDALDQDLPPLQQFILPGGGPVGAALHRARTVCRRAERRLVALDRHSGVRPPLLSYVNRLSDYLFVAARWSNQEQGCHETTWSGS